MALPKFRVEGAKVVLRDENDRIVKDERGKPTYANLPQPAQLRQLSPKKKKETWRGVLGRLTKAEGVEGGQLLVNMLNLANGKPQIHTLPDGRESEPVLVTPEVQRAANTELLQMLVGRSVAQTEVSKAMEDEKSVEQLRAMSDEDLRAIALQGEFRVLPESDE